MANQNVQITKRSFSTTDGSLVSKWCLFVEHNQALYIHLPSVGMSDLKKGTGERECNLRKTSIWLKQERKCPACQGKKLAYHKATAHKDQCYGPDACPRCQGKGWWSLSDEKRWEVYQEARFCEEAGVEYSPSYSTPYQAKAAKVAAVKASMNAAMERRYEAKPLTEYQRKAAKVAAVKARMNAQASANNHAVGNEVLMNLQDAVA